MLIFLKIKFFTPEKFRMRIRSFPHTASHYFQVVPVAS
jgi:hypothetical protein